MVVRQMVVAEGHCPRCAQPTNKIVEFVNDPCVDPLAHVEYHACKRCKKVWEWNHSPLGPVITDMRVKIRDAQEDKFSAS